MHKNDKQRPNRRIRRAAAIAAGVWLFALLPWLVVPASAITCPDNGSLTNAQVAPPGPGGTTFTFSVTYQDTAGETPDWIRVYLTPGTVSRRLFLVSGSLATGAVYSRSFAVATGTWFVMFRVQPGTLPAPAQTC
jgi:hypothetical protein